VLLEVLIGFLAVLELLDFQSRRITATTIGPPTLLTLYGLRNIFETSAVLLLFFLSVAQGLHGLSRRSNLSPGLILVLVVGRSLEGRCLLVFRVVLLLFRMHVIVAESDVLLRFPGIEPLIIALPLDVAILSI
jgi:hypothetical protein